MTLKSALPLLLLLLLPLPLSACASGCASASASGPPWSCSLQAVTYLHRIASHRIASHRIALLSASFNRTPFKLYGSLPLNSMSSTSSMSSMSSMSDLLFWLQWPNCASTSFPSWAWLSCRSDSFGKTMEGAEGERQWMVTTHKRPMGHGMGQRLMAET